MKVCKFDAERGSEVVTARLDKEQIRVEVGVQPLKSSQVGADVLPDCGVGTPTCLDGSDPLRR